MFFSSHDLGAGPETCVIYCRISQDRDGDGRGIERQEEECRVLAKREGLEVTHVYRENDVSATTGKRRPEFEAMLASAPEAIVAWHQDRLLRLTADLEKVIDLGVPVVFVQSNQGGLDLKTPAGRAVARTVAAWSTYEGEQKALRQRLANKQRAEQGSWQFSRRPYGYIRQGGEIQIVEDEAESIREGFASYLAGKSYQAIADEWNGMGRLTTLGNPWRAHQVMQLLKNPRLAGIVLYKGKEVPDAKPAWKPIIDRRTWADFCEVKRGRKQSGAPSAGKPKHLLSGFARCGVCGDRLYSTYVQRPKRKDGAKVPYRVYDCTKNRCISIAALSFESFIEKLIVARLKDPRILRALRTAPDPTSVEEALAELRQQQSEVLEFLHDRLITKSEARVRLESTAAKAEKLEARLTAMRQESPLTDLVAAKSVASSWRALHVIQQRRVIADLGITIKVNRGRRGHVVKDQMGNRTIDPSRLDVNWIAG